MKTDVISIFKDVFKEAPHVAVRAPGRVNLIGDHTDYNGGFVLPLAIDYAVWIALSPVSDPTVTLYSNAYDETGVFPLDHLTPGQGGWLEYVKGVAFFLRQQGKALKGWKGVVASDLPIASGLSSSAALEMASLQSFAAVSGFSMDKQEMAVTGQLTENQWIGVNCGLMDQLASTCGLKDHALLIDCRSLELKPVMIPPDCAIVILDTNTRRKLTDSVYNERRRQCELAAAYLKLESLRDLTVEILHHNLGKMDKLSGMRALHVVSENSRTQATASCLLHNDLKTAGKLLYQSHESLRDLFQVSSPALDSIVESALESPGCFGARMTGAGFGGCAVALIARDSAAAFLEEVQNRYSQKTNLIAGAFITGATDGAEIIELPATPI